MDCLSISLDAIDNNEKKGLFKDSPVSVLESKISEVDEIEALDLVPESKVSTGETLINFEKGNKLERIDLSRQLLQLGSLKRVETALRSSSFSGLRGLVLSHAGVTDLQAVSLCSAMKENKTLVTVDLSWNRIGNTGAKCFAGFLRNNSVLQTLYLFGNRIGDEGAKALASSLTQNSRLLTLDISDNNEISPKGCRFFADALRKNRTLRTIRIENIRIDEASVLCRNTYYR